MRCCLPEVEVTVRQLRPNFAKFLRNFIHRNFLTSVHFECVIPKLKGERRLFETVYYSLIPYFATINLQAEVGYIV